MSPGQNKEWCVRLTSTVVGPLELSAGTEKVRFLSVTYAIDGAATVRMIFRGK
jgi:hypothetical protein